MRHLLAACMMLTAGAVRAQAVEPVDAAMVARIREEALRHSQVMELLRELTEDIGPRLTASPNMDAANAWARRRLSGWGLANVHDEAFADFGRGWEFSHARVEMLAPRAAPLFALPRAWTPGTDGPREGEAIAATLASNADLARYKGRLRGKIVFLDGMREYERRRVPDFRRFDRDGLARLRAGLPPEQYWDRGPDRDLAPEERLKRYRERLAFEPKLDRFLAEEGVLAVVGISDRDDGVVGVAGGGSYRAGEPVGVPALAMMSDHYNEVMRDLAAGREVRLRIDVDSRFTTEADRDGYNTIAEIAGSGPNAGEIVMLGAHMDSWHAGTGASDNGAGVAVMMEAMRILEAVGAHPGRTIRLALWSGEEEGLIGSADYVGRHFAALGRPRNPGEAKLPSFMWRNPGPLERRPDYYRLSAYFNLDNGSGRIRGIYAQGNVAAMPVFEAWLRPFADLGATEVVPGDTYSTDHVSFDRVGLPGFQFIQDDLDYSSRVHHTNLDTYDHAPAEDLEQAAAIVASVAYAAAERAERLPRKRPPG